MIKNTIDLIKEKFEAWDLPMGPFIEIDDIYDDIARFADYLGEQHADEFVKSLIWMVDNQYPHLQVVYEFIDRYSHQYNSSIIKALLENITQKGPPLLVELLTIGEDEEIIEHIVKTIDSVSAEDELLIACIGTIGEIGGNKALSILQDISKMRGNNLSKQALEGLEIALQNNKKEAPKH
ncbi:MAG TPA: hypothetical protein VHY08_02870 [Bacillota bacterium]|nr:hypothetical protein [Bacillota bacterium]